MLQMGLSEQQAVVDLQFFCWLQVRMTRGKLASKCLVPWPEAWKKDPYPSTDGEE
jgi:hypothetical protein